MATSLRHSEVPVVGAGHLLGCASNVSKALACKRSFAEITSEPATSRVWTRDDARAGLHRYLALGRILVKHPDGLGVSPTILPIAAAAVPTDDVKGFDQDLLVVVAIELMACQKPLSTRVW